jgi:tRNA(fMet)-specific endonuclease VapC
LRYLLDTDTCIYALKQRKSVLARLLRESPDDIAVSAMTRAELAFGVLKSSNPELAEAKVDAFLEPLAVLPFDSEAATKHAEIRFALRHAPIGERDMVTASIAVADALTMVTHNKRELSRVPGLAIEDWTEERSLIPQQVRKDRAEKEVEELRKKRAREQDEDFEG